jgi:hypothetical protein
MDAIPPGSDIFLTFDADAFDPTASDKTMHLHHTVGPIASRP